jgi:hypothetical protein
MVERAEKLQTFTFFTKEPLVEKPNQGSSNVLGTLDIKNFIIIDTRMYVVSKSKGLIHVFEIFGDNNLNFKFLGYITAFRDRIDNFQKYSFGNASGRQHYLFAYGVETNDHGEKSSYLKIFEHSSIVNATTLDNLGRENLIIIILSTKKINIDWKSWLPTVL